MKALKPTQKAKVLFDLASQLEPSIERLRPWFTMFVAKVDKWYHSEGNQGLKRAKEQLNRAWLIILNEPDMTNMTFTKQISLDGVAVPISVLPLVRYSSSVNKTDRTMSALLTIVRCVELWRARPSDSMVSDQLKVIGDSRLPDSATDIIKDFSKFLKIFLSQHPKSPIVVAFNRYLEISDKDGLWYSEKQGPNGPLTESADLDFMSICESRCMTGQTLEEEIRNLGTLMCQNLNQVTSYESKPQFYSELPPQPHALTPGKVTPLLEKAGKIRLVASPDYYSQRVLRPLHRWLSNILKSTAMDCTYDQKSALPTISMWHKNGSYVSSCDQTSCTDLFPVDFQLAVVRERFGEKFAASVKTVLCDREWTIKLPQSRIMKRVRWSVGQPLGLYASWPLMAVAHHFLVQYAFWLANNRPKNTSVFRAYVICGDDIVIGSEPVTRKYLDLCRDLGMKINRMKSHMTGGSTGINPVSEFAKIIVWNGSPLYPIKPNQLSRALDDWRLAVPLLIDLSLTGSWKIRLSTARKLVTRIWPHKARFLVPLLTTPKNFGGVGFRDNTRWLSKFDHLAIKGIHPWLFFFAYRVLARLRLRSRTPKVALENVIARMASSSERTRHPLDQYVRALVHDMLVDPANPLLLELGFPSWADKNFITTSTPNRVRFIASKVMCLGLRMFQDFMNEDFEPLPYWRNSKEREKFYKQSNSAWARIHRYSKKEQLDLSSDEFARGVTEYFGFELDESEYRELQANVVYKALAKIRGSQFL